MIFAAICHSCGEPPEGEMVYGSFCRECYDANPRAAEVQYAKRQGAAGQSRAPERRRRAWGRSQGF